MSENRRVLALYDVRGIQNYIFRTSKLRDAVGASGIIEGLFHNALEYAVTRLDCNNDLMWCDENGALPFCETEVADVQVLYIGGGNACVIFSSRELAIKVNKLMSRYTLDNTYSLQLAVAMVDKTEDYRRDYENLMIEMVRVKDRMTVCKPLDAIPVIKTEIKTGFSISGKNTVTGIEASTETALKSRAEKEMRKKMGENEKVFDRYIADKGESSMLAVIHIDGNNMGLRIRELIADIESYPEAVTQMRKVSYAINNSYKRVMDDMLVEFSKIRNNMMTKKGENDDGKWWILPLINAGDDITYVCNANIAFATVEFFLKTISKYGMKDDEEKDYRYSFSACAGISFFNSHFPFDIAYSVAEECCGSAKKRAKAKEYTFVEDNKEVIGSWLDFQFCRNVHALNLEKIRSEEYVTPSGENLLRRPYYIPSEKLEESIPRFKQMRSEKISLDVFHSDMKQYVIDESNIPRSFVKEMRNTYPLGEHQMEILKSFLKSREIQASKDSRARRYPEEFYFGDSPKVALLYDALEVADYYCSLDDLRKELN